MQCAEDFPELTVGILRAPRPSGEPRRPRMTPCTQVTLLYYATRRWRLWDESSSCPGVRGLARGDPSGRLSASTKTVAESIDTRNFEFLL